jgi:hypothetical protein
VGLVSVDELRAVIERHLDDLQDEADRLRAALDSLGLDDTLAATSPMRDTARSRGARRGPPRPGGRTRPEPRAARAAPPQRPAGQRQAAKRSIGAEQTAAQSPVATLPGQESVPATGVDRALQELRSELAAALRNSSR